jgi:hypothetical protein
MASTPRARLTTYSLWGLILIFNGIRYKFFSWLILQNKLRTADRIIKNGEQTNPICQLGHVDEERRSIRLLSVRILGAFGIISLLGAACSGSQHHHSATAV